MPICDDGPYNFYDETGKNRGLKRKAELILLYYVPHEPLSRWIPPLGTETEAIQSSPRFFLVSYIA
jgi:hypothetical protein